MPKFHVRAPAKINLSLQVLGKRSDGFHEIVSLMQTVSLADTLAFSAGDALIFTSSEPALKTSDNLIVHAANLLRAQYSIAEGCHIHLDKRIPIAAGLAGGSSDAAATLRGLSQLWNLQLNCFELLDLAGRLGSDVPFLVKYGTALVEGRGERVSSLPDPPRQWYVLVNPRFSVSTASIFARLPADEWGNGDTTRTLASHIQHGGSIDLGVNDLQPTLFRLHPGARRCYEHVTAVTGMPAIASGSGPTVAGLCAGEEHAQEAVKILRRLHYWAEAVHSRESAS